jgi:hypothetical protein
LTIATMASCRATGITECASSRVVWIDD